MLVKKMKIKNGFVITLLCLCFFINSCGKQPDTTACDPEKLKPVVTEFLESQFILAPINCVEFVKYDSKKDAYEFYVNFNPIELYPELYNENDDVFIYEETVYVQKTEDCYIVFDKHNECTRHIS